MKVIKADLPRELRTAEIHTLCDLHIGDKFCDLSLIQNRIQQIKDSPNAYCILNGDLCNNATISSVSDSYAEKITPMEQIKQAVELLSPIRSKILSVQSGNHENRTYKQDGIDLSEIIARELGCGDKYSQGGSLLFVRIGEQANGKKESNGSGNVRQICYTIYVVHGSGGGRKEGAKLVRLADMASIVDADAYIHGHTHLPMIMKQSFFRTDIQNSAVHPVTKLFVNTAAALDYGGYSETFEYKPNSKDTPVIHLDGTRKFMTATL